MTRALFLSAAMSICLPLSAAAQSAPSSDPAGFCPEGAIVIVDGVQECREIDTLEKLIADIETASIKSSPYSAGSDGDRDALRRLPDVSPEEDARRLAELEGYMTRYRSMQSLSRDEAAQLNYDLLGFTLKQQIRRAPFDEARLPFTNDSGFFNELSYITRQTKFETIDDYEAYAARLSALPRYFGQHKTNLRRGIETQYTASSEILPGIIDVVEKLSSESTEMHPFFAPFKTYPDSFSGDDKKRLKDLGKAAINNAVLPAYRDLHSFLKDEYAPHARASVGVGTTPEGRAYYAAMVRHYTTLDLTPDEVHEIGQKEVKRIRGEMDAIIKEVDFKGSFADFLNFLRTDPQFYAKTEDELMKEAAWLAKQIDGRMPEFFGTLPRLSYGVKAVPKEIAPSYTTGRYWSGSPDQGRAGNYMVNTYDLKQRPLYNLPALTLHEGVPGHHHQISLGQELSDLPRFRRNLYPNAFGEGWGLYSEKLGVEMGVYKTPYENFGRLTYEMWRACRLVVDTGMHWKGWSREQAESCFFENSALAPHNIKTEVERYISWPGQALAYKIGELKILELRERAEKTLGDKFSIREFHDAVLLDGGVPLDILEAKIDKWIADKKG